MSWVIHHIRVIRRWHAKIGVTAMLYLLFLVFSGWALNHGKDFKLDERELTTPWLMSWYGIHAEPPNQGYKLGNDYFAWSDEKWALGSRLLAKQAGQAAGAVKVEGIVYIATASTLYLFQEDGQLLDKLESQSLPATPILALGNSGHEIILKTPAANFVTVDGISWKRQNSGGVTWSAPQLLPDEIKPTMAELLAPGLPVQRVLQDVHSGRIFGPYGVYVVDLVGLALLTLGMSGLWIYWRSVRQGRMRKP